MAQLSISHATHYRYRRPVPLNPHRLMVRPRESRLQRILGFELLCDPSATFAWSQDILGNAIAVASFAAPTTTLTIESRVELLHDEEAWPVFPVSAAAISYPFRYSEEELADLGALVSPRFPDPHQRLADWVRTFVGPLPTDTLSLLKDLNTGMSAWIAYEIREDYGTQTPLQSLDRRRGSCRDIATLLVESVRLLGFGARIVSGYLWDPAGQQTGSAQSGSTHAWVEIYVPGAGWITFDPTNRSMGAGHLIPVAVARSIEQIAPVTGGYVGDAEDHIEMSVTVAVTAR